MEEEFKGSVFIIVQNIEDKNQKYYYSYSFDISRKKQDEDKNNNISLTYVIIFFVIALIIIIIIITLKYRDILLKNRNLEERVNSISFTSECVNEEQKNDNDAITFI